jgi:N,N-dimethylformamidase
LIGNFGLNLGSAVGFEMDSVHPHQQYSDSSPTVLAEAKHPDFTPPRQPPVSPVSHIAIWTRPQGGAVFSAGSVTWTGSLSHNGYNNNVSKMTGNVLRRFLEVPRDQSVIE